MDYAIIQFQNLLHIECYPCKTFMSRKGLSYNEAYEINELDILSYHEYLSAFDNKSRLDRKCIEKTN